MQNTRANFKEMLKNYKKKEQSMAVEYLETYLLDYYKHSNETEYQVDMPSLRDRLVTNKAWNRRQSWKINEWYEW